jgi:hypothetical protein
VLNEGTAALCVVCRRAVRACVISSAAAKGRVLHVPQLQLPLSFFFD